MSSLRSTLILQQENKKNKRKAGLGRALPHWDFHGSSLFDPSHSCFILILNCWENFLKSLIEVLEGITKVNCLEIVENSLRRL